MLKKLILESKNIYRNDDKSKWSINPKISNFIDSNSIWSKKICGVGLLEKFAKKNLDKEFVFLYLADGEKDKEKQFNSFNKNPSEKLVRYVSEATLAGHFAPLCILNTEKGYMRFMTNLDDDPNIEDAEWSKPEKFRFLRTVF